MNALPDNNKKPRSLVAVLIFLGCLLIWSTNWIAISLQVEHSDSRRSSPKTCGS